MKRIDMNSLVETLAHLKTQALIKLDPNQEYIVQKCCDQLNLLECPFCCGFHKKYYELAVSKQFTLPVPPRELTNEAMSVIRGVMKSVRTAIIIPENNNTEETYSYEEYEKD